MIRLRRQYLSNGFRPVGVFGKSIPTNQFIRFVTRWACIGPRLFGVQLRSFAGFFGSIVRPILEVGLLTRIIPGTSGTPALTTKIRNIVLLGRFPRLHLVSLVHLTRFHSARFSQPVLLAVVFFQKTLLSLGIEIGNAHRRSGQRYVNGSAQGISRSKNVKPPIAQQLVHGAHPLGFGRRPPCGNFLGANGPGSLRLLTRPGRQQGQPCDAKHAGYSAAVHAPTDNSARWGTSKAFEAEMGRRTPS